MTLQHAGEFFAGLAAVSWVISGVCFEAAGRRVGSVVVNVLRLSIALILLTLICAARNGSLLPIHAPAHVWRWLLGSGFLGFFICDLCLFRAFILLGARRSLLMMALAPVFAAALDYLVLHAPLSSQQGIGMLVTLAGVVWVIVERPTSDPPHAVNARRSGAGLALIAAIMQALGAITAKIGMRLDDGQAYDPFAATLIRVLAGWSCFIVFIFLIGRARHVFKGMTNRPAMTLISIGAVAGPVLGVVCFLTSLQRVQSGVTQTIIATVPVLMLPVSAVQAHDRLTLRAVVGACVAVGGVIILCLA